MYAVEWRRLVWIIAVSAIVVASAVTGLAVLSLAGRGSPTSSPLVAQPAQ